MIISVDGLISAGKTDTLLKYSQTFPVFNHENNIKIVFEPVRQFTKYTYGGREFNPLELFYTSDRYQYIFQEYVLDIYAKLNEGFQTSLQADSDQIIIVERNLASSRIFIETNRHKYTDFEYCRLVEKHDALHRRFYPNECTTDKLFYLDTEIDTCMDRIQKRKRKGESNIEYYN